MPDEPTTIANLLASDDVRVCFRDISQDIAAGDVDEVCVVWVKKSTDKITWHYSCDLSRLIYFLEMVKLCELGGAADA